MQREEEKTSNATRPLFWPLACKLVHFFKCNNNSVSVSMYDAHFRVSNNLLLQYTEQFAKQSHRIKSDKIV